MTGALLVAGDQLTLIDFASEATPVALAFQLAVRPEGEGSVRFDLERQGTDEEIVIGGLGDRLGEGAQSDLVGELLGRFFAVVEERGLAPDGPLELLHPPWLGPASRHRLRRAAHGAGVRLGDELERGLALLIARIRRRHDVPPAGGWVVADRCGSDLDFYQVDDVTSPRGRELALRAYQRLRGLFGDFYATRRGEAIDRLREPLGTLRSTARWLATDPAALALVAAAVGHPIEMEPWTSVRGLAEKAEGVPSLVLSRSSRHWLFVGDQRLEPLGAREDSREVRYERLFRIPQPAPQVLAIALRTGYGPSLSETYPVATIRLRRGGDYRALEGWLLVTTEVDEHQAGRLQVEIVQGGTTSITRTVSIDPERDDE